MFLLQNKHVGYILFAKMCTVYVRSEIDGIESIYCLLKEVGSKLQNYSNLAATDAMGPNEAYAMCRSTLPNGSRFACTAAH